MKVSKSLLAVVAALLIMNSARAGYDPTIGRWLSRDPMNNAELRQGANLYSYVQNDPVNAVDPLGLLTLHYWQPASGLKGAWLGHVSLTLDNGTYVSYWPSRPVSGLFDFVPPRIPPNYSLDLAGEDFRSPADLYIGGLDEAAIERWWNDGGGHGDFSAWNNCSGTVSEALRVGGLPLPMHWWYEPEQVHNDVNLLLPTLARPPVPGTPSQQWRPLGFPW